MAEFSSCYFCGAALDAPLDEYPVVPAELHPSPEQQGTVVLCPTCREKLGAIVGEVIDAVETDASLDGPRTTDATLDTTTGGRSSAEESGAGSITEAKSGSTTDADSETDEATEGTSGGATETPDETPETETTEPITDAETADPETETETTDGDSTVETKDEPPEKRTTAVGETERDPSPIFDDESEESDDSDPYDPVFDRDGEADATTGGSDEDADDPDEEPGSGESGSGGSKSTMPDAQTYNRVVRLLQNREFPVDRDEIEAVATNAYELSTEEFDAVIRVAVERGVLEENDGLLELPGSE